MTRSILTSLAYALVFALANVLSFKAINWPLEPSLILIYAYMVGLSVLFHSIIKPEGDPKKFVTAYMAFSGGRLFLSLFIILGFALLNKAYLKPFAVTFLFLYFGFTILEIVRLWGRLKK